jgi:hypothetical protein
LNGATTLTPLDLASLALLAALALLWLAARRLSSPGNGGRRSAPAVETETLRRYHPADFAALVDPAAAPATLASPDPAAAPILAFLEPSARLVEEALSGATPPLALVWARYLIMLLLLLVLLQRLLFG